MNNFLRLYRWSMQMKLHMALYTFVAIFIKALVNLALGIYSVPSLDMLTMWLTCMAFAIIESLLFAGSGERTAVRSALWIALANLLFIGGACVFGWFEGVPVWCGALLVLIMELGLGMMWFGDRFVLRMDSAELTRLLKRYQQSGRSKLK